MVLNIAAFVLGCIGGLLVWKLGASGYSAASDGIISVLQPFGNVLIFMLKMIVVPIILCSLVCGAASLPFHQFGKIGVSVIIWYLATSLYAAVFGSVTALVCNPKLENVSALTGSMMAQAHSMQTEAMGDSPLLKLIYGLFMNPFQALAEGRFLPVIVFSILLGLAARAMLDSTTDSNTRNAIAAVLRGVRRDSADHLPDRRLGDAVFPHRDLRSDSDLFRFLRRGAAEFVFSDRPERDRRDPADDTRLLSSVHLFDLPREPVPILWKLREPILTAFVTRSSAAALPVSLRTAHEKMHVRKELAGFTLSLGATVNMDGVCLHLPVFAVLAANLFGFSLEPSQIFLLVISVVFASVGAGGVPGGSIFLLFMVLDCLHLTPEQSATIVALALGINPLLDMFETACNVAGDNVGTYIISKRLRMIEGPSEKSEP
ncbi:MAG: dicarboxylate/amino acid:cation symporter [Lentisphaeria bacterium]|nr:dicarboxylate/amino acid:cation symporter [Lentisphaeria bacterium]